MSVKAHSLLDALDILVVEDEMLVARALQMSLILYGAATVTIATTLEAAEITLCTERFDVVILDRCLPAGDSLTLGAWLVSKGVPVLVHSGHADAEDFQMEGARFCAKPARAQDISEAVAALVGPRHRTAPQDLKVG